MSDENFEFVFEKGEPADPKESYPYNTPHFDTPHRVLANTGEKTVGQISWSPREDGRIRDVYVQPAFRRQGIATRLFEKAQHLSTQFDDVMSPKHNASRTVSGDAWAKSVGGELPEINPYERSGGIWG